MLFSSLGRLALGNIAFFFLSGQRAQFFSIRTSWLTWLANNLFVSFLHFWKTTEQTEKFVQALRED